MSYTIFAVCALQINETRAFSGEGVDPNNNQTRINQNSINETLNSASTPAVTKSFSIAQALSGGAATLDVTNVVDATTGATVTLTGLTPVYTLFTNPSTNANPITITFGAANGYTGFGAAYKETLAPGSSVVHRIGSIVFDASHKTFDLTGTGSQILNIQILAG